MFILSLLKEQLKIWSTQNISKYFIPADGLQKKDYFII
jgi:hypothetical protein